MAHEGELTDPQRAFHMAEFDKLNREIAELIKSTSQLFNFAVLGAAAVLAWVLTSGGAKEGFNCPPSYLKLGLWIPLILSLGLAGMASANAKRIGSMGRYLRDLEKRLGHADLGWEKVFETVQPDIGRATRRTWIMLFVGCGAVALIGSFIPC